MKPIDSNGREIPLPPDARSAREVLAAYGRVGLWMASWLIGVAGLLLIVSREPFTRFSWQPFAFKLLVIVGVTLVFSMGFAVLIKVLAVVSWPLRRRQLGQRIERRIERFTPEQIADEIALARQVLSDLRDPDKRRGWQQWLAWLERQANVPLVERKALAEGIYPSKRSAAIGDVLFFALILVGGIWLAWGKGWMFWLFVSPIIVICGLGAATHIGQRLELTADTLTYHAMGRRRWSAPREHIATKEEGSGSSEYELYDLRSGKLLGAITGATFGVDTVEALMDLFPPLIQREEA